MPPRTPAREILDETDLPSEELKLFFEDLDLVNRRWGNVRTLARRLRRAMRVSDGSSWTLLDVGAGAATLSGHVVRRLRLRRTPIFRVALDINWHHLMAGRALSGRDAPAAVAADAFRLPFPDGAADWIVSTLFFHHFSPEENVRLLKELARVSKRGLALLDIRRSYPPLLFLSTLGRLLGRSRYALEDGITSVRQAYTAAEAREIVASALPGARVERVFPCRLLISL